MDPDDVIALHKSSHGLLRLPQSTGSGEQSSSQRQTLGSGYNLKVKSSTYCSYGSFCDVTTIMPFIRKRLGCLKHLMNLNHSPY